MTNWEFYKEMSAKVGFDSFAINAITGKPSDCSILDCEQCMFSQYNSGIDQACNITKIDWLFKEYEEPKVDWSKIPVDTSIYVSDNEKNWFPRYFAKYENGEICVWACGTTSFSTPSGKCTTWPYAKLANEAELKNKRIYVVGYRAENVEENHD